MKIDIDFDDKKLKTGFVNIEKANQIATARTLSTIAALVRKNAIKNIRDDFILRNTFVTGVGEKGKGGSIIYKQAKTTDMIQNMQSSVCLLKRANFMKLHEEGGIKKSKRGNLLSIAQLAARSGSKRKLINRNLYLSEINKNRVKGKLNKNYRSKKAQTVARAYVAYRDKKFLTYDRNIYKITSFTKSKNRIHFKKKHIYNLSQRHARIKRKAWMKPAIEKPIKDAQNIYNSQIKKLLKKDII